MSYISKFSKKRSKNFVSPTVVLLAGIATTGVNLVSASADTTETGWDKNGNAGGTMSDANATQSSAASGASSAASDRASEVTSNAPEVSGSTAIGWVDVYVDHSNLDDAIREATAQGVSVVRDPSVILTGDAPATAKNTSDATKYYADKAAEIKAAAEKHATDMGNYNASVAKNKADADEANAQMAALRSNLAAQGQTTTMVSKQYSADAFEADKVAIQKGLADGRAYLDAKDAVQNATNEQNAMTLFTTAAAQGHVKLARELVTVGSQAEADAYIAQLETQYQALQTYVNGLSDQNGSIPDDQKPTYTMYSFTIDPTVEAKGVAPVPTYNYTAVPVTKPVTPSVNYHIFDIRSQPTSESEYNNKDGETIVIGDNANAGGNKVAQAIVNQTIGIDTDNQPLPSERFDKIQDLTIVTKLPSDVEFDLEATNTDPTNWTVTYDKASNTVTQTATAVYLVQVNLNQNTNNSGTVGGTTNGEWKYDAPQVFFKLLKDNQTYQATSTTIVNKEYMFVGKGIQIRTDSADPTKVNTNSKYQNIDGKAVLPGSINNYILGWDFNQYKGVNIDREMQEKGLHLVDDYPEEAVSLTGPISVVDPTTGEVLYSAVIPEGTTIGSTGVFQGADGKDVDGFVWKVIDNDSAPENLKGKLNGQALMISYTGVDNAFYKKYVEGGKSLNVIMPMTTLKIDNTEAQGGTYNGNEYKNVAFQSDFGNDYKSNEVINTAPLLDPRKDAVISFANLTSLDINKNESAEIENGTHFQYRLGGSKLPTNLSEPIKSYVFTDELPVDADEYNGEFIVQTNSVIKFKAGSTLAKRYPNGIPANSDISKYFTQSIQRNVSGSNGNTATGTTKGADTKVTRVEFSADSDFLDQIDYDKTNVHFDVFMTTKRIANIDGVKNVFNEVINGIEFGSTEVLTNSKPNALDILKEQLDSLQSSASSGIASNSSDIASMTGALSVIVKNVSSLKDSTSSAVSSLASDAESLASSAASDKDSLASDIASNASTAKSMFDHSTEEISYVSGKIDEVASSASSAIDSIASSASSAIASNSASIGDVASSTSSQVSSVASDVNKAVSDLAAKLAAATQQSIATMTIYDKAITTDAGALAYAVNRGVAAGSVKSIKLDTNGNYVVSYNESKTAINNSPSATTRPVNSETVAAKRTTISFYTLKTKADVYTQLAKIGYPRASVVSITETNGVFLAIVDKTKLVKA